eukprot:7715741-Lingulodinium_polyedra.AAC.1
MAEAEANEVPARAKRAPPFPGQEEIDRHELTHLPPRGWCDKCVPAKAADDPHRRGGGPGEIDE